MRLATMRSKLRLAPSGLRRSRGYASSSKSRLTYVKASAGCLARASAADTVRAAPRHRAVLPQSRLDRLYRILEGSRDRVGTVSRNPCGTGPHREKRAGVRNEVPLPPRDVRLRG